MTIGNTMGPIINIRTEIIPLINELKLAFKASSPIDAPTIVNPENAQ